MQERDGAIRWAPKVEASLVRRVYEQDARGIVDSELIDELAYALLDRCEDILIATEAQKRATCPRCQGRIVHDGKPATLLKCGCGWESTWESYHRSIKGNRLHGGTALPFFVAYVRDFERARSHRDKMLLIDRLLNAWHHWARSIQRRDGRTFTFAPERDGDIERIPIAPAAVSLIAGRNVVGFLDELSGVSRRPDAATSGCRTVDSCSPSSAHNDVAFGAFDVVARRTVA